MANIMRYSPSSDMMDEMFKNFMSRPMRFLEDEAGIQMRSDLTEDHKNIVIKSEIPGVKKRTFIFPLMEIVFLSAPRPSGKAR